MSSTREHKDYLDYLKAIASFFVVLGHSIAYLDNYTHYLPVWARWISLVATSTHVPLFFVIAGYLCREKNIISFYKGKIIRILIPFLFFTICKLVFTHFISNRFSHGANLAEEIYDAFYIGGTYWFVYCLLLLFAISPTIWRKGRELKKYNYTMGSITIALIIFNLINIDFSFSFFPNSISIGSFEALTPFYQIERACMYMPYFLIGMMIRENENRFVSFVNEKRRIIIATSVTMIGLLSFVILTTDMRKGYLPKMIIAFSTMTILYIFLKQVKHECCILKLMGKYSLQIMLFDSIYRVVLYQLFNMYVDLNVYWAIIICIVTIVLSVESCLIIRKTKFIKVLIGV